MTFLARRKGYDLDQLCLSFIGFEGSERHVKRQRRLVGKIVARHGGLCVGRSPGELYDQKKFDTPYIRDYLLDRGALADVSETSAPWSLLPKVYDEVMAAAHGAFARLGVSGYIMCHLSHSYHAGACLYFTFAIKPSGLREPLDEYDVVKSAIQQAFIDAGATLATIHAVGTEHARWLEDDISAAGVAMVRALLEGVDPARTSTRARSSPNRRATARRAETPRSTVALCRRKRRRAAAGRAAELVAALCLATDLGMAFPFEHGLHSTLIAMRIADRLGVDRENLAETYYACLLSHSGCTTDAHVAPHVFGGSLTTHLHPLMYGSGRDVLTGLLGRFPTPTARGWRARGRSPTGFRDWCASSVAPGRRLRGGGHARRRAGGVAGGAGPTRLPARALGRARAARPREGRGDPAAPMRIVTLAVDAAFQRMLGGDERVVRLVRERAGHAFDPQVADCLIGDAERILARRACVGVGGDARVRAGPAGEARPAKRSIARSPPWATSPISSRRI